MHAQPGEQRVTFGPFCLDLRSATLLKGGTLVRVPDQSLKVLAALLETPGDTVSREELRVRLWPNGTYVEFDQGLNSAIKRLRAALCDSAAAPRYIETQPKRGYRFICPIQVFEGHSEPADASKAVAFPDVSQQTPGASSMWALRKLRIPFQVRILLALISLVALVDTIHVVWGRRWAHQRAIPQAWALAEKGDWESAYDVACAAAARLPTDDQQLQQLWPRVSRELAIISEPPGAEVLWRPYVDRQSSWRRLGRTPLHKLRVEAGTVRLRLTKPGYSDLEIAGAASNYELRLEAAGQHAGMVHIPAGPLFAQYSGLGKLGPVMVGDFWIDRNEVSNLEFQEFVKAGGYRNRHYWRIPFVENGHALSWEEAIARFVDQTGRHAPAGWTAGGYPEGQSNYPVSGVSWYEAAAYAEFAGKALPNIYEWFRAAAVEDSAYMMPLSNYSHLGPMAVRSSGALGRFGAYDMAGNVREWCFNESAGQRFILGGAWSEPTYMSIRGQKLQPFSRSPLNGLRCAKSGAKPAGQDLLTNAIPAPSLDEATPVTPSAEVFATSRHLYQYQHSDLQPIVESKSEFQFWRRETLRFPNGRGKDQLLAYLFLPAARRPPYQCVIYVPSGDAFQAKSGADIQPAEYILRSGRAMMYPIFWGTYDRFSGFPSDPANSGYPSPVFIREGLIAWKKDLSTSIDYLQTRKDIRQIGYLGVSAGANFAPVLLSGENRVKAAVFLSGAIPRHFRVMPESNPVNFAPNVTIPILMINGKYDSVSTGEEQELMLQLLGTSPDEKRRVLVESGHAVFAPEVLNTTVHETLAWFDRYLGLP